MSVYTKIFGISLLFILSNYSFGNSSKSKMDSMLEESSDQIEAKDRDKKFFKRVGSKFEKLTKKLADGSDLDFGTGLSDIDNSQTLSTTPSLAIGIYYTGSQFRRIDQYQLAISTDPLGVFDNLPVYGLSSFVNKFKYTSYYQTSAEAMARPMHLNMIPPFSAKLATKMQAGDVFETDMTLNLAFGNTLQAIILPTTFGLTHKNQVLVSGLFNVQIQALNEKRVRVRISTAHSKNIGITDNFSPVIVLTEVDIINNMLSNFIYLNLLGLSNQYTLTNTSAVEYMFDLSSPEGAEEYDKLFNKVKKWKKKHSKKIGKKIDEEKEKPKNKKKSVQSKIENFKKNNHDLVSDLTSLQEIIDEDKNKPIAEQRVRLLFKGDLNSLDRTTSLSIGLFFRYYYFSNSNTQWLIDHKDTGEGVHDLYIQTDSSTVKDKLWFGLKPNIKYKEQFVYLDKDVRKNSSSISVFGQSIRLRQHHFTAKKYRKYIDSLRLLMPEHVSKMIEVPKEFTENRGEKNVLITHKITLANEVLNIIKRKYPNKKQLKSRFKSYLAYLKREKIFVPAPGCFITRLQIKKLIDDLANLIYLKDSLIHENDINIFLRKPGSDFKKDSKKEARKDSKKENKTALELWESLKTNSIYRKIGLGLLFSVLNKYEYKPFASFSVTVKSPALPDKNYSFSYGSIENLDKKTDYGDFRWSLSYASSTYESLAA